MLKRFLRDESGVTAIEYGLIVALMFLAIVTALGIFATRANTMFNTISTAVTGVTGG